MTDRYFDRLVLWVDGGDRLELMRALDALDWCPVNDSDVNRYMDALYLRDLVSFNVDRDTDVSALEMLVAFADRMVMISPWEGTWTTPAECFNALLQSAGIGEESSMRDISRAIDRDIFKDYEGEDMWARLQDFVVKHLD